MKRLLITGAAGALGGVARARLGHMADVLRLSDIADMGEATPNEEIVKADLADPDAVMDLVAGCDGVVHFGGVSRERGFEEVLHGNIRGIFNLYEAVRAHRAGRVFFASSNHAIGFYPQEQRLTADVPPIADSLYGASKVYGEQIALIYWHKYGVETARVRIGSCFPAPTNRRMLSTWLGYDDLISMIERVFRAPHLGCPVIWGVSDNASALWDNASAGYIGWRPTQSSQPWREAIEAADPTPAPDDPQNRWHGGAFTAEPVRR